MSKSKSQESAEPYSDLMRFVYEKEALQHENNVRSKAASLSHSDCVIKQNLCIDPEQVKKLKPSFGKKLKG